MTATTPRLKLVEIQLLRAIAAATVALFCAFLERPMSAALNRAAGSPHDEASKN